MALSNGLRMLALVLCAASPADIAHSGPDEVTDRLMDEAASLFDIGMLRLELRLSRAENISPTFVYYDWDANQIVIWSTVIEDGWDLPRATQACDSWFAQVRRMAHVDPNTGKVFAFYDRSAFADMFTHNGFTREIKGKSTSEVATELDSKFSLRFAWQRSNPAPGEVGLLTCSGVLTEKGYSTKSETAE